MRMIDRIACLLVCCGAALGHEIGTTVVTAEFTSARYDITIATDATALAEKLAVVSGTRAPASMDAAELGKYIGGLDATVRTRVELAFDGQGVQPEYSYRVEPPDDAASAAAAIIRLTGALPAGAKHLTWKFGWTFASYAMKTGGATIWLEGNEQSGPIALAQTAPVSRVQVMRQYLALGFTHIVPLGLDHMLFVLGIYLLSGRARPVLLQVSAFTLAHSITLGLSLYGLVSVSPRIVEPLIAISIAYVAIENIFVRELHSWRVALVFAFGLLHGLGFAGVLTELGLPRAEFLTALISFNAGVEVAQLAIIGAAFLIVGMHWSERDWYRRRVVIPASVVIAATAVYWTVERLV
jgi:hydrogenase/urease accessory protein HupE